MDKTAEKTKIVVRVPMAMRKQLETIATSEQRDVSKQVRYILDRYLCRYEGEGASAD